MRRSPVAIARAVAVACTLTFVAAPAIVFGQVNIESMRQQQQREGFALKAALDLSTRSGNVDDTNLDIAADVRYRRSLASVLLAFRGDYGWQGGEQFSDEGLAHLRYTHGLSHVFALEGFVQSDYNKARLLDARALVGAGVRVVVVETDRAGLAAGTAWMFEHEEVDVPSEADHPAETDVHRWSSYLGFRWTINENTALSGTGYAQPQLDEFEDVRVIATGSLETRASEHVALRIGYRVRHDSRPPDTIESTDSKLTAGLSVSF